MDIPIEEIDSYFEHSFECPAQNKILMRSPKIIRLVNPFMALIKCPICRYQYPTIIRPFKRDERIERWEKDVIKGIVLDSKQGSEEEAQILCLDCFNSENKKCAIPRSHILFLITQEILEHGDFIVCDQCGSSLNKARE